MFTQRTLRVFARIMGILSRAMTRMTRGKDSRKPAVSISETSQTQPLYTLTTSGPDLPLKEAFNVNILVELIRLRCACIVLQDPRKNVLQSRSRDADAGESRRDQSSKTRQREHLRSILAGISDSVQYINATDGLWQSLDITPLSKVSDISHASRRI